MPKPEISHTLFITGAAGYIGAMLADQFSKRSDVLKIICLDKEIKPELLKDNQKIIWIQANTADKGWAQEVATYAPDILIHAAWQIRALYGKSKMQWLWNVKGSERVFDFTFDTGSVRKLIYFSTASVYGAYPSNTLEYRFVENNPLREDEYLYGIEKRAVEERLKKRLEVEQKSGKKIAQIAIVRPAAITGPRGRFMRVRFGLQSALSGQLKDSLVYQFVSLLVSFVPATPLWCRQFIHEDDVTDIVSLLSFSETPSSYEVFNITPPGEPVRAEDMARAVGKKTIRVLPSLVRLVFFLFWHGTRGKIPTSPGGWKFYSYPVVMDGTKITKQLGYTYAHNSYDAFTKKDGRYASYIQ
jgi:nucleoside-diphosphate-sugar epimerase